MVVEEKSRKLKSKLLYKTELLLVKYIPPILVVCNFLNTIASYFSIDLPILSYFAGCSVLTLIFLYISSILFGFCLWHRLCIAYVGTNWLLNILDYYMEIPLSDRAMLCIYLLLAGIFLFWALIEKFRK